MQNTKYKTVNWIANKKSPSYKPQAASRKQQAASRKQQAPSNKRQASKVF